MATWAAICITTKYHTIPLHSDGPYGRSHVAHSRGSVATQATISIAIITRLSCGHTGGIEWVLIHEHLGYAHVSQWV